ncbi:phosphodiesterase [Microbacterium sp. YY-01]|uniref:phosphodiesterase n=1 Tax=Microbacterium sp. YY-01 TaxID=3421634 RepID=UPI003D1776C4
MAQHPVNFGQYPLPTHTIVHLSDTHLLAGGALLGGRYDTRARLQATVAAMRRMQLRPDALVITGDLTDLAEPAAYADLRSILEPLAAEWNAPLVWVAGNHDERPALHEHLLDGEPSLRPVTGVWNLSGLRLVAVDTSVPGWHHGEIDDDQREWLAQVLQHPAPHGTILAMHHPPVPSHIPFFDVLELRNQQALAEVVRGSDVRAILAGHLHYSTFSTFAGIPVSVASASCYTMNLSRPAYEVNGMDSAQAFQLVHVRPETITHSVVPAAETETAEVFTSEWVENMARLSEQERLEAFSRKR